MATRYMNGHPVQMTAEEEAAFRAEQVEAQREHAQREWRHAMAVSDHDVPRWLEDLADANASLSLPQIQRDRIAAKKALRAPRPE